MEVDSRQLTKQTSPNHEATKSIKEIAEVKVHSGPARPTHEATKSIKEKAGRRSNQHVSMKIVRR